jgi:hypothetical protein
MSRFDALHLFLDESGKLEGEHRSLDVALVGGVLLFGDYEPTDDVRLRDSLRNRLAEVGGNFPGDLHVGQHHLQADKTNAFLRAVDNDVNAWAGPNRSVYGVAIQHETDLYEAGPALLREAAYDNRYISMLWALVEHLLFIDERIAARLNPRAKVHLHIASRQYCFSNRNVPRTELQALGFKVNEDKRRGGDWYRVCSLHTDEVRGMLRIALRRWDTAACVVSQIEMSSLDYQCGTSPAALYLADLYLGQIRQRLLPKRWRDSRPKIRSVFLDDLALLEYGPRLDLAAKRQAALSDEDLDGYLALLAADPGPSHEVDNRQARRAAGLLARTPEKGLAAIEQGCREVDLPGTADSGLRRVSAAARLLQQAGASGLRADVLVQQARLSHANHMGDVATARNVWREYESLEPRLPELAEDGLRYKSEMRIRRAVGLMDSFEYDGAVRVLNEIGASQEQLHQSLAAQFDIAPERMPSFPLGMCYSAFGQAFAFRGEAGDMQQAELCFRSALGLFTDERDRERELVYLGHLACDQAETGRSLWQEIAAALPDLRSGRPACRPGGQYVLALQLKGLLRFASTDTLGRYLDDWSTNDPLVRFDQEALHSHPFGLVHQALALCHARAWHETQSEAQCNAAVRHFETARTNMNRGGALLKVLALVCRLRQNLFEARARPDEPGADSRLFAACRQLEAFLLEHFGSAAWGRDDHGELTGHFGKYDPGDKAPVKERAQRLVEAVRFNYW